MSLNWACGSFRISHIPDFELLVVTNGCENVLVEMVPSDVLDDSVMGGIKAMQRLEVHLVIWQLIDVPNACLLVVWAREEKPFFDGVPRKPVALLIMTFKLQVWFDLIVSWDFRVLIIVKDVDVAACCFRGDNLLVLRHVSGFVDLSWMVDLDVNLDASLLILRDPWAADTVGIIIARVFFVIPSVFGWFKRDFNWCYLQIVLFIIWSVRSNQYFLDGMVRSVRLVVVGHPLASESGPRESMGVERIVEIWGVLLPDLVLLHHFLLLDVIGVFNLFLKRVHNFILSRDL